MQLGKIQTEKTVRTNSTRQIQIKKQKQVGKYKSAKISRENTSRRIDIEILENMNRGKQVGKQPFRTYKSGNTNRKITNR